MGGLKLFGRRWGISTDDFVFPGITEGILRFLWFVVMLAIYSLHSQPSQCPEGKHIQSFVLVLLLVNSVTIVLSFLTAYVSSRGVILRPLPRRSIPALLYMRSPLILFEFIWNIVGSVWISGDVVGCDSAVITAVKFTVVVGWLLFFAFLIGLWMVFDPLGNVRHDEVRLTHQRARLVWRRRLQLMFICASRDDNATSAFEHVAELLSDFFKETDLVATDVWAGLLLLANQEFFVLSECVASEAELDPAPDWMNVSLASRMMDFALAVYGWPYYVWDSCSPSRWTTLLRSTRCCQGCRCDQVLVIRDNCCRCNTAAFLLQTDLRETDLFYVSFHNQIYEVPFVACADPRTSTIVVAIRGSLSLRDVVTDLCATDQCLDLDNEQFGQVPAESIKIHKGILCSARYVYSTLEGHKVLEDLFVLYPDYDLVVTGHSLGGGVAAALALLLKPKFPSVRCFAFAAPGCVLNSVSIPFSRSFICSVVLGDDLISRLSYDSIRKLRRDVIEALENCDRPKYEILLKGCFKLLCGIGASGTPGRDDVEAPPDPQPPRTERPEEPLLRSRTPSASYTEPSSPSARCPLLLPGRVLHVTDDGSNAFAVQWSGQSKFSQIRLSSRMLTDHLPHAMAHSLHRLAQRTGSPDALRF